MSLMVSSEGVLAHAIPRATIGKHVPHADNAGRICVARLFDISEASLPLFANILK